MRGRGLDPGHVDPAPRRHGQDIRLLLRPINAREFPAAVHLRPRPPTGAVASRFVAALAAQTPLLAGIDDLALVDLDDTIVEVHGHGKQGASFGYTGVRGLNASAATVTAPGGAPVIVATRLRKGSAGSARGAGRIVADALRTVRRLRSAGATGMVVLRADSAYFGRPTVLAAVNGGAQVSVTVR